MISRFLVALIFLLAVVVSTSASALPEEIGPESTWSEGIEAELSEPEPLGSRHESVSEAREPQSVDLGEAAEATMRGRFADEPASPPPRR